MGPRMPGRSGSEMCGTTRLGTLDIPVFRHLAAHLVVSGWINGRQRREAVDIPVEHAERCGDEDRVVDFDVGRTLGACSRDVFGGHLLAALLDLRGNREER